jgi:hypothetical protein
LNTTFAEQVRQGIGDEGVRTIALTVAGRNDVAHREIVNVPLSDLIKAHGFASKLIRSVDDVLSIPE